MTIEVSKNERQRQWAQYLTDSSQVVPAWWLLFCCLLRDKGITTDAIKIALDIIDQYPPFGTDTQCQTVINLRLAEERLLDYSQLVNWLYADKVRFGYLQEGFKTDPIEKRPMSLLELMREAYEEYLRTIIADIEYRFNEQPTLPQYVFADESDQAKPDPFCPNCTLEVCVCTIPEVKP